MMDFRSLLFFIFLEVFDEQQIAVGRMSGCKQ